MQNTHPNALLALKGLRGEDKGAEKEETSAGSGRQRSATGAAACLNCCCKAASSGSFSRVFAGENVVQNPQDDLPNGHAPNERVPHIGSFFLEVKWEPRGPQRQQLPHIRLFSG